MTSIYLQLNFPKRHPNKLNTFTQETNTTTDKFEDKTKSSLIHLQAYNNKNNRFNYYLKRYENYFHKKLVIKYNILPQEYNKIQLNNFIASKYCRDLAVFKESLIYNDIFEFLKRYYRKYDSVKKIPNFSEYYKSYFNFFCFPTLAELRLNFQIEEMIENKAQFIYNDYYKDEYSEEKKEINKNKNTINIIIFTNKIRNELSKKNTLTDLSKISILNKKISNKSSVNSVNTINKIMNYLDYRNNYALTNNNILLTKNNKSCDTEKIKIDINNNKIIKNDDNKINNIFVINNINNNFEINLKNNIIQTNKTKMNYTNDIIKLIKPQNSINQINKKHKINKINKNSSKNYKNQNNKESKKSNMINNINTINKYKGINNNNLYIKINKNIINKIKNVNINSKKIHIFDKLKDDKGNGNNTEREKKNFIPHISKNKKFDKHFHTFLKIALNFKKITPKNKPMIKYKKINNNKISKICLTDRNNSSHKLKNIIKFNNNLTEDLKYKKKNSRKENSNKSKKLKQLSRNYGVGFEENKISINKTSFRNKLKDNIKLNYNSTKKQLNPQNKYKMIIKKNNSKNKTQKILKISKDKTSFIKKEKSHLTTISLSRLNTISQNKKKSKFKIINVKKSLLPLNRILIKSMGISYKLLNKKKK